jgi:Cu/Ag efflux protein CusF
VTFNDGTKTVYTYEDNDVTVTATLQHANAIPDNAELKVTPVTKTTSGYNYDAYMQAVNSNAEAVASVKGSSDSTGSDGTQNAFNENNSRLYDIAFISDKTDENGNAISGEKQEYEPTEGSVKISMSFKNKQLTNDIKADNDVSIIHLSLSDDAKKNADTTAEAKDITSSDVKVQVVSSSTPITTGSSDQVSYDLSSFSLVLYAGSGTADSPVGGTDTYLSILGQARFYGIVANEWTQNEAETNAAVKVINANAQTGTDMTNVATQPWIVGKINGELHFKQGSNAVDLWCTYDDTSKILNQTGKDIAYHYASETDLDAAVDTLLSTPKAASTAMANVSGKVQLDNSKYVTITKDESGNESDYKIDLTSLPKGTYYVDSTEMNLTTNGNLHIFINNDQYIVFTNRSDTVTLQQYDVTIGGTKINAGSVGASGTGYGDTPKVAEHVYWNMPNATTVSFGTSSSGLFLAWKATVTIENSCNGWIVADKVINKGGEWHSVYQEMDKSYTQPASTVFAAKKTVNTAAPDASQIFDFNLDKWDSTSSKWVNVTTARNSGTDVIFPNVSFTEAGTFIYRISENLPADSIYELANGAHAAYYVKVVVVKTTIGTTDYYNITSTKYYQNFNNGDVNGELQDNKPSNAVINNTYKSKIKLCVTKAFSGRELTNDDSFTFTLAAGTNNPTTLTSPMPAQGGNTVTVKKDNLIGIFGEINFTEAGTYNYTIQETIPKGADENGKYNNIQYDKTIHTATIVVEKNTTTNSLEIKSLKYDTNQTSLTVTNTYDVTGKAELSILKALSTGAKPAAGIYSFELKDSEGKVLQTKSNDAEGKVTFDAITYTLRDLGGEASKEFTYTIHESSAAASGWTNATDKTVTVTVTDDGSGTLKVQYDGQDTFTAPTMTNTYGATGKAELSILKALSTGAKPAAGIYSFELKDSEGKVLQTKSNDAEGKVTFDAITYTLSDLGGEASKEFTYTIHESSAAASGWTNAADKTVNVTVSDNGDGTLKVQYDGQDTFTVPTMTNTYGATGKAELSILKALSTGAKPAAGIYSFELKDSEGKVLQTKSNDAYGKVTFDAITYTLSDLGGEASKKFTYRIHESSAAASGWTNAPDKTVTVTVTDDGSGTLKVQYDGQDTFTAPTMTNTYGATGKAELSILKALSTGAKPAAGKYTFELEDSEGKALQTKSNDADGKVTFDAITYTLRDLGGEASKEFTYTIHESSAAASGWTNAPDKTVTVTVTDDGSGTLKVQYDGQDTFTAPTMTNTYGATGKAELSILKALSTGAKPAAGIYTFELEDSEGKALQTKSNDADGKVTFDAITYTLSDLGGEASKEFTYRIHESSAAASGWTNAYSGSVVKTIFF